MKNTRDFLLKLRHPRFFSSLILSAALVLLYSVSLGHNFLFDEENIILINPLIRKLSNIPAIFSHSYFYFDTHREVLWRDYYRPLTTLSFLFDYQLWQVNPLGYNLTNLLYQIVAVVLLYRVLARLLAHETAAFMAALLFAVHTIHTEAVTYIASRGDILGSLLMLLAIYLYSKKMVPAAALSFGCALFAKESVILLPFYLFVFDLACLRTPAKKLAWNLSVFVLLAMAFMIFRRYFCPVPLNPPKEAFETVALRVLSMGPPFLEYLKALALPEPFKFCMEIHFANSFRDYRVWTTVVLMGIFLFLWIRSLRGRGPLFFGLSVFLAGLVPYCHLVHFYPEWAEHYLYIPSIGLAAIAGAGIRGILEGRGRKTVALFFVLYGLFASMLCLRTWQRNVVYNDPKTYYTLLSKAQTPYAYYGYQNLARILIEQNRWRDAFIPLKVAEKMQPYSDVTHNILGHYYLHEKKPLEALAEFKKAYAYSEGDSRHLKSAGMILVDLKRYGEAEGAFLEVRRISPKLATSYTNLMMLYELMGDFARSQEAALKGLAAFEAGSEEWIAVELALARLEYRSGQDENALERLNKIAAADPEVSWGVYVARFATGKLSAQELKQILSSRYVSFKNLSSFLLMGCVLQGKTSDATEYLKAHDTTLGELAKTDLLFQKELEIARKHAIF